MKKTTKQSTNKPMGDIVFFGAVDRKEGQEDGIITSEYPAWMHDFQIDELREEIEAGNRNLAYQKKHLIFDPETRYRMNEQLEKKEKRLEEILKTRPKLRPKDKDDLANARRELEETIRDSMYTRSEMKLGTANPHEEARRMSEHRLKCPLSPELARSLNLKTIDDGYCNRTQLEKAYKIISRALGEHATTESLRRDRVTVRSRH